MYTLYILLLFVSQVPEQPFPRTENCTAVRYNMGCSTTFTWLSNLFSSAHVSVRRPSSGFQQTSRIMHKCTRAWLNTLPLRTCAILESSICATLEYSYDVNIKRNLALQCSYDVSIKRNPIPEYSWCLIKNEFEKNPFSNFSNRNQDTTDGTS